MVLEHFLDNQAKQTNYLKVFAFGAIYAIIGTILAYLFFQKLSGIVAVCFVALLCAPFLYHFFGEEERRFTHFVSAKQFLAEYLHVAKALLILFAGMTLGFYLCQLFSLFYSFDIFNISFVEKSDMFVVNLTENLATFIISFLISFLFGLGAIMVIAYVSSMLAVTITSSPIALLWGIPEIFALTMAGLAGSILSFAFFRHEKTSWQFQKILKDVCIMFFIGCVLVLFAALLRTVL